MARATESSTERDPVPRTIARRQLWSLIRAQRLRYAGAVAAMLLSTLLLYIPPLIGRVTIDSLIRAEPIDRLGLTARVIALLGGREWLSAHLWVPALAIVMLTAVSGVLLYLKGRLGAVASEDVTRRLRNALHKRLQELPCSFFDQTDTGDLVQRCTSDVETIRMFLSVQVTEIGRSLFMLVLVVPIMLHLHRGMTAYSMALVVPIVGYALLFFFTIRRNFRMTEEAEAAMTARLQENLGGIRVVRAFGRQEYECRRFAELNGTYRARWNRTIRLFAYFWSVSDFLCLGQLGIVLAAGTRYIAHGEMTVGTFFAFWSYVNLFMWPVRHVGRFLGDLGKTMVSFSRVCYVFEQPAEADEGREAPLPSIPTPAAGRVEFRNVHFAHGDAAVLHGVSLVVEPGQTLAILGPSGSGKSTLISLLLRLYDYNEGDILIDGVELRSVNRRSVREQTGVVMQEPFLYARTIAENIHLKRDVRHDEAVEDAARVACIHDTIADFSEQYNTVVGERGVTLSGGQRQRVALARAILSDPPILVLDDALSSVDVRTENMILSALRERRGRRTTIVIAHRLSTLMAADVIAVIEEGRITQLGTHAALVRQRGLYRRLWEVQSVMDINGKGDRDG